jgi:hypothetical protein
VHAGFLQIHRQQRMHAVVAVFRQAAEIGHRIGLDRAIHDDLVAHLIGVGQVQDVARHAFEPLDVAAGAPARNDAETRRPVAVELQAVLALLQAFGSKNIDRSCITQ